MTICVEYELKREMKMNTKEMISNIIRCGLTIISPKLNTRVLYRFKFGHAWDINHPTTLNDKLLWLKYNTYWNNPTIKMCADKYRVREYLESKGMGELLPKLIGVYKNPKEIPWSELPKSFVIKINVGCGMNILVKDKSTLDIQETGKLLKKWLKNRYYLGYAEMQYKDVETVILIEEYIGNVEEIPQDYKFYCFNGDPKYVMVCADRKEDGSDAKYYFYDRNWNKMPYTHEYYEYPDVNMDKPEGIECAFQVAEKLCRDFPFVRVDLYIIEEKVYFGELTFTPSGAMDTDLLSSSDELFGTFLSVGEMRE